MSSDSIGEVKLHWEVQRSSFVYSIVTEIEADVKMVKTVAASSLDVEVVSD